MIKTEQFLIDKEYMNCVHDLLNSDVVLSMEKYIQHGTTTTLQHCINVSYYNYKICKMLSLDYRAAARGGLLHDLFLYDWHDIEYKKGDQLHAFSHANTALLNAQKYFDINNKEKDIISKHMFPLSFGFPKYKETIIITLVDKWCGLIETLFTIPKHEYRLILQKMV